MLDTPENKQTSNFNNHLQDPFGRRISYLRLSVTDRCDFRCTYCMDEKMHFLPKTEVLTIEELIQLAECFMDRGIKRIRLTGGEPLVRRGIMTLIEALGAHTITGKLEEVTLTTNGNNLEKYAKDLFRLGIRRINLSLDTLNPEKFQAITRRGDLVKVLKSCKVAQEAGLAIKINMVVLKGINDSEIHNMLSYCIENGMDLTLIEAMPIGKVSSNRDTAFYPLTTALSMLEKSWALSPSSYKTGGPARYYDVSRENNKSKGRLGLISPLTNNFCANCNRVRVTCTGQIYLCLGHDDPIDLRAALRSSDSMALYKALDKALLRKPEKHLFNEAHAQKTAATTRHMNVTGG